MIPELKQPVADRPVADPSHDRRVPRQQPGRGVGPTQTLHELRVLPVRHAHPARVVAPRVQAVATLVGAIDQPALARACVLPLFAFFVKRGLEIGDRRSEG